MSLLGDYGAERVKVLYLAVIKEDMEKAEHLCDPDIFKTVSTFELKKMISGRRRRADPFICGGCFYTFTTICSLHIHCQKHNEGGSYYFDSLTRTAYPKYDTACVYTQVTPDLLSQVLKSDQEKQAHVKTQNSIQFDSPSGKMSKRITKQRGKKIANKGLKTENDMTENHVIVIGVKNQDTNDQPPSIEQAYEEKDDGTEVERIHVKIQHDADISNHTELKTSGSPVNENISDLKPGRRYSSRTRKAKRYDAETLTFDLSDNENADKVSGDLKTVPTNSDMKKTVGKRIKRKKTYNLNSESKNIHCTNNENQHIFDSQKSDELTASEVLLAISKGDSADLKVKVTDTINNKDNARGLDRSTDTSRFSNENARNIKDAEGKFTPANRTGSRTKGTARCSSEGLKEFECKTCGKKGSNAMLTYHKYLHMDRKSFACEVCGLLFQIPRSLAIHKRQHEEKEFRCVHCPAAFHRKQYLDTHLLKHSGENPFMCDLCGKSYRDRSHLKRHIKHVHENVRDFQCDICTERFYRSDHLKNHRLRHFMADKKCQFCNRMFKHPEDLVRHTRTHTGEKEWFCHVCGHGFVAVTPYYTHMAKKHNITRAEAKVWKDKSREEYRRHRQLQEDSSIPVSTQPESAGIEMIVQSAIVERMECADTVVQTHSSQVLLNHRISGNTSDVSTYVDLPSVDNAAVENEDNVEEETFTENNLLIKFATTSESGKSYTSEEMIGGQVTMVTDLMQGSEVTVGGNVSTEMVQNIHNREVRGDGDYNVIIAVDNMEFGADTVMFIDGDQCQSEVIIDNHSSR